MARRPESSGSPKVIESETLYRQLFRHMDSAVAVYQAVDDGADFVFLDVNPALEEVEQVAREDLIGRRVTEAFPGVRELGLLDVFQRVWRTGRAEDLAPRLYRDERIIGWRENHVLKLPENGALVAIYKERGSLRDILDRLQAYICVCLPDGTLMEVNQTPLDAIGQTREDVLGKPFWETYWWSHSAEHRDDVREMVRRAAAGEFVRQDIPVRMGDDTVIMVDGMFSPLSNEQGEVTALVGFGIDVSQRHEAERMLSEVNRTLEKKQADLDQAQRIARMGSWVWEIADGSLTWSDQIYRIFGLAPQEFDATYDAFQERIHPDDRQDVIDAVDRAIGDPGAVYDIEHRIIASDGSEKFVRERGEVEFAADGTPLRMLGTVQDITEITRMREALEKARIDAESASQAKSFFLSNMSHELRTPLNAIIGFSDMMLSGIFGSLGSDHYREYAADINRAGSHLLTLIQDILDVSRIEAGELALQEEDLVVGELLGVCDQMVEERGQRRGLALVYDWPPDLPRLRADATRVKQILLNLISNAIKFTPAPGRVDVVASLDPQGRIVLRVSDTGIGIKPADMKVVLDRFGQASDRQAREMNTEGTGLGLTLVQMLCDLHGARFSLASEFGKGTTATVVFPAHRTVR